MARIKRIFQRIYRAIIERVRGALKTSIYICQPGGDYLLNHRGMRTRPLDILSYICGFNWGAHWRNVMLKLGDDHWKLRLTIIWAGVKRGMSRKVDYSQRSEDVRPPWETRAFRGIFPLDGSHWIIVRGRWQTAIHFCYKNYFATLLCSFGSLEDHPESTTRGPCHLDSLQWELFPFCKFQERGRLITASGEGEDILEVVCTLPQEVSHRTVYREKRSERRSSWTLWRRQRRLLEDSEKRPLASIRDW